MISPRVLVASAVAVATLSSTCNAFVPLSLFPVARTATAAAKSSSSIASTTVSTSTNPTFTSDGAKSQIGNDSFLNENLMARAQNGPGKKNDEQLHIGIVGAGLAGMVAAMDLADAGHKVELFEVRPFVGGKVSSWKDKEGNHIEMGKGSTKGIIENVNSLADLRFLTVSERSIANSQI
jgi:zeta-carotene desaturase